MHVLCSYDLLRHALAIVSRAVASRNVLPSLGHVLLSTDGGRLRLAATNLEMGITQWVDADVRMEGAVTVPAKLLHDVVGGLPQDQVAMTLDERTHILRLECGNFEIHINGAEAAIFPHPPVIESDSKVVHLSAATLRETIKQVAYAASTDTIRPVLQGVHLRLGDMNAVFSAADGFRMAQRTISLPEPVDPADVIIPARTLVELARILDDDGSVALMIAPGGEHVLFAVNETHVSSRVIHGTFPNVERVIPAEYRTYATIDRDAFARAIKLASFFADSSSQIALLQIVPEGDANTGQIVIRANAVDVGDNTGWVDAAIRGEETRVALNVKFLADAIAAIPSQHVVLHIQSPQAPVVLKPDDSASDIHLIMPMIIHGSPLTSPHP